MEGMRCYMYIYMYVYTMYSVQYNNAWSFLLQTPVCSIYFGVSSIERGMLNAYMHTCVGFI